MNWRKWLDEFVLAGRGILLATREKTFWYGFVPSFLFFGLLINLLSGGTAKFELMAATGFLNSLKILGDSFLAIFGFNHAFLDWFPIFLLSVLQGILLGVITLLAHKKRPDKSASRLTANATPNASKTAPNTAKTTKSISKTSKTAQSTPITAHSSASKVTDNLGSAGIITGLIALGAGCPTCGVTLITPLIGAIFSTGSLAIAGAVSSILTVLAIIIAILSLKRLGEEVYVIIINEQYLANHASQRSK